MTFLDVKRQPSTLCVGAGKKVDSSRAASDDCGRLPRQVCGLAVNLIQVSTTSTMSHSPADFSLHPIIGTLSHIPGTAQNNIWSLLTTYSVEAILSGYGDFLSFAGDHCVYSAAVKSMKYVEMADDDEDAMKEENIMENDPLWPSWPRTQHTWRYPRVDEIIIRPKRRERLPVTVGFVYLSSSLYPSSMNLGIVILPEYRKSGFGTEAVRQALKVAFTDFQCHRVQVQIGVPDRHERVRLTRLFTSLGFKHEGIARRALLAQREFGSNTEDDWRDVTTLALVDTDFISLSERSVLPASYVKMQWDELFIRHERERECMLEVEEHADMRRQSIRRTSSMETIKHEEVIPETFQGETSSQIFEKQIPLSSPTSALPPRISFGKDVFSSHNQLARASSSTSNDDVDSILRRLLSRTPEGSNAGSRRGSESPESSELEYASTYGSPPPGTPLSYASWDSDAESDWTSASRLSSRASQSGESDWDVLDADDLDARLTTGNSIRN